MAACPREEEVLAASSHAGPSPYASPSFSSGDLAQHLLECEACAELVTSRLIAGVHADDLRVASVPSAGQVWWRVQVRARAEARHAAERPMQIVHAVAGACMAGALAAGIGWASPWIKQTAYWFHGTVPAELGFAWWLAIGAWLILAPVALYFVFARE
jgi:hypothetical protein